MGTQLTPTTGVWKPATEMDKMKSLAMLAKLPMRNPTDLAMVKAIYMVALDGVAAFGLARATQAILRGSLGHAFMPSPPELRQECERFMDEERDKLAKAKRQGQLRAEKPVVRTPEEIAHHRERMRRFYNAHDAAAAELAARSKAAFTAKPPIDIHLSGEALERRRQLHPPDWQQGEPLTVTPALLKALQAKINEGV